MRIQNVLFTLAALLVSQSAPAQYPPLGKVRKCILKFPHKEGVQEARTAAKLARPRFLTAVSDGTGLYEYAPGISDCALPRSRLNRNAVNFSPLWQADRWQWWDHRELREQCLIEALRFAGQYNQTLAKLRPDALQSACKGARLNPAWPPPALRGSRSR